MKVCLIRLDKIGDLVCSLPVDEAPWLDGHQIRWVVQQGMGFIASNAVPGRRFLQLDKNSKWESFRHLLRYLKEENFQVAVSFQAPWWVSLALWWRGVPLRAGVLSQWHSFLFFNRGLRQRRSLAEKHEADYNLELLAHAIGKEVRKIPSAPSAEVVLCDSKTAGLSVEELIASRLPLMTQAPRLRMRAPEHPSLWERLPFQKKQFVVVHPGMTGSALNWPQKNYVSLIRELAKFTPVVITGTPADQEFLRDIELVRNETNIHWLVGEVTATELLGVLAESRLVIAPSTGVAHLGAALGTPVISLFSPLVVQRPTRWAPRGTDVTCFLPSREGEDCMADIAVETILEEAKRALR